MKCKWCNSSYNEDDSRDTFGDYLYCDLGYGGSILENAMTASYDPLLCGDCNISKFNDFRDEFEDRISDPNV